MMNFLLPVDGSENSDRAVRFVIALHQGLGPIGVRLLHVETLASSEGTIVGSGAAGATDASRAPLQSAQALLDEAGIRYTSELRQGGGYMPQVIAHYARETDCAGIVMGTRGMGSTAELFGSIARQVVSQSDVPVTLVK